MGPHVCGEVGALQWSASKYVTGYPLVKPLNDDRALE